MSQIQGLNGIAFSYQDPNDPTGLTMISVTNGYAECANSNGGPSFGGAQQVGFFYYWESLSARQADIYLQNMLPIVDETMYQMVTPYVQGNDDYDTFFSLLQTKYPLGTKTDPYP